MDLLLRAKAVEFYIFEIIHKYLVAITRVITGKGRTLMAVVISSRFNR